jgi:hypothetical protein
MHRKHIIHAGIVAIVASIGGCQSPESFVLPAEQKVYVGKDFELDLPKPGIRIEKHVLDNRLALDFFAQTPPFSPLELYSIEWTILSKRKDLPEKEFLEWMHQYIPDYLTKNFESGHYTISFQQDGRYSNGLPSVTFAAFGHHNGGRKGAIYGTAVNFGHHLAVFYLLTDHTNPTPGHPPSSFSTYPDFQKLSKFALGFKYKGPK